MTATDTISGRTALRGVCLALIAIALGRLVVVVPRWVSGAPPAYPGQFLDRLYFVLVEVPILSVTLLALGARGEPQPWWRRVLPWALLAASVVAMAFDARRR